MATNITITGNLSDFAAGADNNATCAFRLVNYKGTPPSVNGTSIFSNVYIKPTITAGAFSQAMYGNDQITPGGANTPPQTYYEFTVFDDTGAILYSAAYQFTGTHTYDISTRTPMTQPVTL